MTRQLAENQKDLEVATQEFLAQSEEQDIKGEEIIADKVRIEKEATAMMEKTRNRIKELSALSDRQQVNQSS